MSRNTPCSHSITTHVAAIITSIASALFLSSCSSGRSDRSIDPSDTRPAVITGAPATYNADDVGYANDTIAHDQQGAEISALAPAHSTNRAVLEFAASSASTLQADVTTAKVLLVQWQENPDLMRGGGSHRRAMIGAVDRATIAKLGSLQGTEFDSLWLHSMIGFSAGAIEIAKAEISHGENASAIALAKQTIDAQQAEIRQMEQILRT